MSPAYLIPQQFHQVEETIKNSRFITQVFHIDSIEMAKEKIKNVKAEFPDARHHCSAFIAKSPNSYSDMGFSDDGEPSGTAGKPMLAVLQGAGIGEILVICIRYFGGIKLGTGGLVKAYAGGVKLALSSLPTQLKTPTKKYRLLCDYAQFDQIQYWLIQDNADILATEYQEKVDLLLALTDVSYNNFQTKLNDIQLKLERIEQQT